MDYLETHIERNPLEDVFRGAVARYRRAKENASPMPSEERIQQIVADLDAFLKTDVAKWGMILLSHAGERLMVGTESALGATYYLYQATFGVSYHGVDDPRFLDHRKVVEVMIASGYLHPDRDIGNYLEERLLSVATHAPMARTAS